jgi:hypothetical protein
MRHLRPPIGIGASPAMRDNSLVLYTPQATPKRTPAASDEPWASRSATNESPPLLYRVGPVQRRWRRRSEAETRSLLHSGRGERDDRLESAAVADVSLVSTVRARGRSGRPRPRGRRNRWPKRPRNIGPRLGRPRTLTLDLASSWPTAPRRPRPTSRRRCGSVHVTPGCSRGCDGGLRQVCARSL